MGETFDKLRKDARAIELSLETRLTAYARMDAAAAAGAPNGSSATADIEAGLHASELAEVAAARDIEELLGKLIDTTDRMARIVAESPSRTTTAVVQRYREVTHDMKATFRKQQANHKQRLDATRLHASARAHNREDSGATDLLLRERASLSSSNRAIDGILAQAAETRDSLARQRASLANSGSSLSGIAARLPTASALISAIQQRRLFNDRVSAAVVALVICFFVYWFVLRRI